MKKQKIDATDKQIIKYLQDGRKSFSYVASKLNVTENTIRNRLNKLYDDKVFSLRGLVDPEYTPYIQIVIFGLKITGQDLEKKAEDLSNLPGVISTAVVTGRYDIFMVVELPTDEDNSALFSFMRNELGKFRGISSIETFPVFRSNNFYVPYLL